MRGEGDEREGKYAMESKARKDGEEERFAR